MAVAEIAFRSSAGKTGSYKRADDPLGTEGCQRPRDSRLGAGPTAGKQPAAAGTRTHERADEAQARLWSFLL